MTCIKKFSNLKTFHNLGVLYNSKSRQNFHSKVKILKNMEPKLNKEYHLKHLFDGTELNVYDDKILNLGVGAPGEDLLQNCCDIFQQATTHCLKNERDNNRSMLFQYGAVSGPFAIRQAIAKYFSEQYKDNVKSEDLFITTGATQGLHFLLTTILDLNNGCVFVDEFTYMIALDVMKQFTTLRIIPVPLKNDGVDVVVFEKLLEENSFIIPRKPFWAIYYTIPVYHNPTGIVFSEDVCKSLIKLARTYDFAIVCDDVYNLMNYNDNVNPPRRLFSYDSKMDTDFRGNVVSNGSFSKIIGPGVRLGWIEAPARIKLLLDRSGIANSGGCFNNYTSGVVASLFELGLAQEHIKLMYDAYKERMLATLKVLETDLPEECTLVKPQGGYFIWLRLPEHISAIEFRDYCLKEELIFFIAGLRFAPDQMSGHNCLRLSIAFHSTDKLVDGVKRLCNALKCFLKS